MKKCFLLAIIIPLFLPFLAEAQDSLNQKTTFNIESSFDVQSRKELTAVLIKTSRTAYWYLDSAVLETPEIDRAIDSLSMEFEENIYPALVRVLGSEWNPGIDKDMRLTILMHPMEEGRGGYFDSADEYPKVQITDSNEREMIYLNSRYISDANAKVFLAHELVHLITFNQKDKIKNVSEEVWLNEARADYVSTLLGYDNEYQNSNLQKRVKDFLNRPSDSLTEWRETASDYGAVNLFAQYLVDHYGIGILADSLKLKKTGIESLNAVLAQNGFKEDFSQIFINWSATLLINNCQVSEKYCYYNQNLKDFRIIPLVNYLPPIGNSTLSVTNTTKDWSGNWHRFIGGDGTLELEFRATAGLQFKVLYIIEKKNGNFIIDFLELNGSGLGKLRIEDFNAQNSSLTIIPVSQAKLSDFSGLETSRLFSWSISSRKEEGAAMSVLSPVLKPISQMTKEEILERIAEIKNIIVQLQSQLAALTGSASCSQITQNLYFGMKDNFQVKCLQEFLKSQGSGIYPEGITNGNFYALTQKAVIRFQEKYASEILAPAGEIKGTGYVGPLTRAKINALLTK